MNDTPPLIWVLADDRMGNVNQAVGVAESLGVAFEIKNIRYDKHGRLPNIIRGAGLLGIDLKNSSELKAPWPDIVIGAGRKTAPVSRYIKKISGKTKLIQLMWPGFPYGDFDLIVTPKHDNKKAGGRIINSIGAPNRISHKIMEAKKAEWQTKFAHLPSPKVALLIGGNTKMGEFTADHAHDLVNKLELFFAGREGALLITNSRRTSANATEILKKEIKIPHHFHDVSSADENPYFGYLACADVIITSGDSISMCSEACTTGKPVYIYAPENITPEKHRNFHKNLYASGCAKPLDGHLTSWKYSPLNDASYIAEIIRKNYF